jgi:hypothetical protein
VFALAVFCLLIGASTSILGPSIGAATLVSATTSMMAMLAAPVLAVPEMLWGWRGNLIAASVISLALSAAFFWRGRGRARLLLRADLHGSPSSSVPCDPACRHSSVRCDQPTGNSGIEG